jgi:hypothetical protein
MEGFPGHCAEIFSRQAWGRWIWIWFLRPEERPESDRYGGDFEDLRRNIDSRRPSSF